MELKLNYETTGTTWALLHEQDFEHYPTLELFPSKEQAAARLKDIATAYFEEYETDTDDWDYDLETILDYGEARLGDVTITMLEAENLRQN